MKKLNLICLPHAGGNANSYYGWKKNLENINVFIMEYAGHGKRIDDEFYKSYEDAIKDIFNFIKVNCNFENYVLFGHSMGAHLAYELYYYIESQNQPLPNHIIFSGSIPPHMQKNSFLRFLPDSILLKQIIHLGGIPQEIVKNKIMLKMIKTPLIKDIRMINNYKYEEKKHLIKSDVSVFTGLQDKLNSDKVKGWQRCVEKDVYFYEFSGGHFFIKENETEVLNNIKNNI